MTARNRLSRAIGNACRPQTPTTAATKVATKARAGDVTTELILEGLWQLKNEKLDGLGPGASFGQGSPAKALECYYPIRLDGKGFSAPQGSKLQCLGGAKPSANVQSLGAPAAGVDAVPARLDAAPRAMARSPRE